MTIDSGWTHAPGPDAETYLAAETTRRRLHTVAGVLGLLLTFVCLALVPMLVSVLQPTRSITFNVTTIAGIAATFALSAVPYTALVLPLALSGTGVTVRYIGMWGVALVREERRWRVVRLRRQAFEQVLMPNLDTVGTFMFHEHLMIWAACVGLVARSVMMFFMAWLFGVVLGGVALVFYTCIVLGTWALGAAIITAVIDGFDRLLTRGIERPVFTEQRRITLQTRSAICAGTRPRDIPQHDIDTMTAWGDVFPELDSITAPHWARARLTAAACRVDRGDFDAAIDLLESVATSKQRVLALMVFEARFALAYCLALQGLSMSTARDHFRVSRPRHAFPYELAAIRSLLHVHANEFTSARREAERALRLSCRPLSIGDANALREQMQALLARLDAPRT